MLNVRDPRAQALARELAERRQTTMTQVIISALENELARDRERFPLRDRLGRLAEQLSDHAGPNRREVGKAEIDEMWGQ